MKHQNVKFDRFDQKAALARMEKFNNRTKNEFLANLEFAKNFKGEFSGFLAGKPFKKSNQHC